jgi:hypothetical protein
MPGRNSGGVWRWQCIREASGFGGCPEQRLPPRSTCKGTGSSVSSFGTPAEQITYNPKDLIESLNDTYIHTLSISFLTTKSNSTKKNIELHKKSEMAYSAMDAEVGNDEGEEKAQNNHSRANVHHNL